MVAGVDPGHRRDRTELADRRVNDIRVVHDIGVVTHRRLGEDGARADRGVAAERRLPYLGSRVDHRFESKLLRCHVLAVS